MTGLEQINELHESTQVQLMCGRDPDTTSVSLNNGVIYVRILQCKNTVIVGNKSHNSSGVCYSFGFTLRLLL